MYYIGRFHLFSVVIRIYIMTLYNLLEYNITYYDLTFISEFIITFEYYHLKFITLLESIATFDYSISISEYMATTSYQY